MQTTDSQKIVLRFFAALETIIAKGEIRGKQTFTRRYNINRWNFLTLQKEPHRDIFQPAWLSYLVNDYNVSPGWLLTGKGKMFVDEKGERK